MSIERCEHHGRWDSDFHECCPVCDPLDAEEDTSWIDDAAVSLIEVHVTGRGYVVRKPDGDCLRHSDPIFGGTRVTKFDEWGDAYLAARSAIAKASA